MNSQAVNDHSSVLLRRMCLASVTEKAFRAIGQLDYSVTEGDNSRAEGNGAAGEGDAG
jgi:hypothetical protein